MKANPEVPSPIGHGWFEQDDGAYDVVWMEGSPAPEAVVSFLACKCAKACVAGKCPCLKNGLKCTELCKLFFCENWVSDDRKAEVESEGGDDGIEDI